MYCVLEIDNTYIDKRRLKLKNAERESRNKKRKCRGTKLYGEGWGELVVTINQKSNQRRQTTKLKNLNNKHELYRLKP